jgi:hypothetical protein
LVGELEGGMTKHLMERAAECATKRVLPGGTLLGVVLLLAVALSACATAASDARRTIQTTPAATSSPLLKPTPTAGPKPFLPGQAFWKDGASSLLFGTNDPDEYYANNIETQPFIQQQLKAAGATLIRTFIDEGTSDAQIDQRIATVQNIGAQCLVVISGINDLTYYKHVVSYIGDRCLMYDFGNEPDWNYISVQTYSKAWIAQVPVLRAINPHALFFGPVVSYPHTDFLKQFLINAQAANVLPDAVSFHWYACWKQAENVCLQRASPSCPLFKTCAQRLSRCWATTCRSALMSGILTPLDPPLPMAILPNSWLRSMPRSSRSSSRPTSPMRANSTPPASTAMATSICSTSRPTSRSRSLSSLPSRSGFTSLRGD